MTIAATPRHAVPRPIPPAPDIDLPESLKYRIKNKLLGKPLHTEALEHERLGNPTALAIFASDCLSSSAYATEEILRVLIIAVGLAAFSLVVPLTIAMIVVLFFLILSYRETIKAYPTAGGAYTVTADNFGLLAAQVAGVALLTDYILTVAVSVAAGTAAIASAFPAIGPYQLWIAVGFIILIAFGNLRGLRESGAVFRVPTYFFIGIMLVMFGVGFGRMLFGHLPQAAADTKGLLDFGKQGTGLFLGASAWVMLHAFASGGTAVTGVEAISNGVPAFRKPEWLNARKTLQAMGALLAVLFLGLSTLAAHLHVAPHKDGTPTVISEVGRLVFGPSSAGKIAYYLLQAATMAILVMAANTSFADFPRLASFHAGDNFMPRQLTKRGHRLQFSNGIIMLAAASILLLIVTNAQVDRLIPLYAIGVFTSFTLSQAGMAKRHIKIKEEHWRRGLVINGIGSFLSFIVLLVVGITKFKHGAWVIIILVPIMVWMLVRLNRQYEAESKDLTQDALEAASEPVLSRHVVMVFVNRLDSSSARSIQYARTLNPQELRAVHIAVDHDAAQRLATQWASMPLKRFPLEIVDCPDRRLDRVALETVAAELADGDTEVSVLLPHRVYTHFWQRFVHDRSAEMLTRAISRLPHANVTQVPFLFESKAVKVHHNVADHIH